MADQCPVCHTGETQAGLDRSFCLNCGAFFHVNDKGETVKTDANEQLTDLTYDGPLEPETKGGRGIPVATGGGSTESALQQEGALPQHGIPGRSADGAQTTAFDTPDGFTVPVAFNERLDPLAAGLAAATTRGEEQKVVEDFVNSGKSPEIAVKVDSQNADALGNPAARKSINPVHDDTSTAGSVGDQPAVNTDVRDPATPADNPDSLPAQKTARQKETGEVVNPDTAGEVSSDAQASEDNPPAPDVPVAQPFAENAVNPKADAPVVESRPERFGGEQGDSTLASESTPEPDAVDTPDNPKDDHDPAQNTKAKNTPWRKAAKSDG